MGEFLVGPDLLRRRPPVSGELPSMGGAKHSSGDGSDSCAVEAEALQVQRLLAGVVGEERAALGHRLVRGVWSSERGRVRLAEPSSRGNFSRILGARPGLIDAHDLFPEEALFLAENEALEIMDSSEGLPLSIQQAYNALLGPGDPKNGLTDVQVAPPCPEQFLVFSRLLRSGHRLCRPSIPPPSAPGVPEEAELDLRERPQFRLPPGLEYSSPFLFPSPAKKFTSWAEWKKSQQTGQSSASLASAPPDDPLLPALSRGGTAPLVPAAEVAALSTAALLDRLREAGPRAASPPLPGAHADAAAASFELCSRAQPNEPVVVLRPSDPPPGAAFGPERAVIAVADAGDVTFLRFAAAPVPNLRQRLK